MSDSYVVFTPMESFKEYDLNVFYEDLGHDADGVNQWSDVFTIQPSAWWLKTTGETVRQYLESFKLSLGETRMIAPDFPLEEWGDDFFISLDAFESLVKVMPNRIKDYLSALPDIESIPFDGPEYKWLDTMF